jgi:hypothetical protein
MRGLRRLLIVPIVMVAACYRFVPTTPSDVTPPMEVRARLSDEGAERFGGPLNRDLRTIDGRLLRWDEDGAAVEIRTEMRREGFPPTTLTEVLELAPNDVTVIERRRLDAWQTGGLVAAIVGGTVAAVLGTRTVGGGQGEPEPPDEGEARIGFPIHE